jgi:hypothetical protein
MGTQFSSSQISGAEIKQAQVPHNLFIAGLFIFNLLMTPAVIALKIGMMSLFIPLLCSGCLVSYCYWRGNRVSNHFVAAHWKLAYKHGLLLFAGYSISGTLIFLAWLFSTSMRDAQMGQIVWTALTRIALVPTLIFVMITMVMEFSAYSAATKRKVPGQDAPIV